MRVSAINGNRRKNQKDEITNMKGKVMTVQGLIDPEELGITSAHEHLILDSTVLWREPTEASLKEIAFSAVDITHLGVLRYHPNLSRDNCLLTDIDLVVNELKQFQGLGGASIVDQTSIGLGRDPAALFQISRETGVHIVMGCGYYVENSHPPDIATKSIDQIAEGIERDIIDGVGDTGIHAGVIGEIGTSFSITRNEEKVLRAAAKAQLQTALPLSIHLWEREKEGLRALDILKEEGVDLSRVAMAHLDPNLPGSLQYHKEMAKRGAFLVFDEFGHEDYYKYEAGGHPMPSDYDYCVRIKELIQGGFLNQILLAQDICYKIFLTRYGGFGYGHILRNIKPMLLTNIGLTEREVQTILEENPRTWLTIR